MTLTHRQLGNTGVAPADRRRLPRYNVHVQIDLLHEGITRPLNLATTDLSRGGCYVPLMMALPISTYVTATLWLDACPVRIRGRVVTRHPQFGNGIMFLGFEENDEQSLVRYLDSIAL